MIYRDYVITAISLLVIALILGGIRVRQFNFPYLYFLFGIVVVSLVFTDNELVGNSLIAILHPLFIPFLFIIGPGLYGSIQSVEERRDPWHIIHYLPLLIGYVLLFIHWFLDPAHYSEAIQEARNLNWQKARTFYPFSDSFILLGYPIYTAFYYILCLRKLKSLKSRKENYLLPVGLLIFSPIIFDVCYHYIYGYGLIINDAALQRYILIGAVLIIFWDVIIIKPPTPHQINVRDQERLFEREYPKIHHIQDVKFKNYINSIVGEIDSNTINLLNNKQSFILNSGFSLTEWEAFFFLTKTNWNYFKKFIRVRRALNLMDSGFLNSRTMDDLATAVGYSTRASLYTSFRQISGQTISEYKFGKESS